MLDKFVNKFYANAVRDGIEIGLTLALGKQAYEGVPFGGVVSDDFRIWAEGILDEIEIVKELARHNKDANLLLR